MSAPALRHAEVQWPRTRDVERELYPSEAQLYREIATVTSPPPSRPVDDPGDDGDNPEPPRA